MIGEGDAVLNVYPNPASDILTIELQHFLQGSYRITLYDILGKNIMAVNSDVENGKNPKCSLTLSGVEVGIYLLIIDSDQIDVVRKFRITKYE